MNDTNIHGQEEVVSELQKNRNTLKDLEAVRELFAKSHDFIAQASYPGNRCKDIAEVLNFLAFQYNDFKLRCEALSKQIQSTVDVEAAKGAVDAVLADAPVVPVIHEANKPS